MDLKEIESTDVDIAQHWYYKSKSLAMSALTRPVSPKKILDVGAGSGFFSRYLLANSSAQEAWCVDTSYKLDSEGTEGFKAIHFHHSIPPIDVDLVLMMDVLEHVDDDRALLLSYVDKVPTGCNFLITVPAFNFLWIEHDVFLEHKRRYTLTQLEKTIHSCGLRIKSGSYFFGTVFPLAAAVRLLQRIRITSTRPKRSQLTKHFWMLNQILYLLCRLELFFFRWNRYFGLTVFCLAEKSQVPAL